jgi:hypothetical protein
MTREKSRCYWQSYEVGLVALQIEAQLLERAAFAWHCVRHNHDSGMQGIAKQRQRTHVEAG